MITGHGGDIFEAARTCGCKPNEILDLSSNMNPLGTPRLLLEHLGANLAVLGRLPEADARGACESLARRFDLDPQTLVLGSGTTQFIYAAPSVLKTERALVPAPTYSDYTDACRMANVDFEERRLPQESDFEFALDAWDSSVGDCDTFFFCNPNNPTGRLTPAAVVEELCRRHPRTRFIIDESYLPLCPEGERESLLHRPGNNRIVLRSLSKAYCIPGLRIGFLVGSPQVVERFRRSLPPWSVNSLAQCAVDFLVEHRAEMQRFVERSLRHLAAETRIFIRDLRQKTSIEPIPSATVFVLARLPHSWTAARLKKRLLADRILIRDCANFRGLTQRYVRFSLKDSHTNRVLMERLTACCPQTRQAGAS